MDGQKELLKEFRVHVHVDVTKDGSAAGDSTSEVTRYRNHNENTSPRAQAGGNAISPIATGEPVGVVFWLEGSPTAISADPLRPPQVTYGIEDEVFRTTVMPGDDREDILGRIAGAIRQKGYELRFRGGPEPRIYLPFPGGREFADYLTECLDEGLSIHWSLVARL